MLICVIKICVTGVCSVYNEFYPNQIHKNILENCHYETAPEEYVIPSHVVHEKDINSNENIELYPLRENNYGYVERMHDTFKDDYSNFQFKPYVLKNEPIDLLETNYPDPDSDHETDYSQANEPLESTIPAHENSDLPEIQFKKWMKSNNLKCVFVNDTTESSTSLPDYSSKNYHYYHSSEIIESKDNQSYSKYVYFQNATYVLTDKSIESYQPDDTSSQMDCDENCNDNSNKILYVQFQNKLYVRTKDIDSTESEIENIKNQFFKNLKCSFIQETLQSTVPVSSKISENSESIEKLKRTFISGEDDSGEKLIANDNEQYEFYEKRSRNEYKKIANNNENSKISKTDLQKKWNGFNYLVQEYISSLPDN